MKNQEEIALMPRTSRLHAHSLNIPENYSTRTTGKRKKTVGECIEKDEDRDWLHQNLDDIQSSIDG